MRPRSLFVGLFVLALTGCHREQEAASPQDAIVQLRSADWDERRHAADKLRDDNGPPEGAIEPLLSAIQSEQNPKAFGAMMITLGASGIAEARPIIDPRVNDPDEDMRRWARRALAYWLKRNGLLAEGQELPPPPHPLYQWPPPQPLPAGAPGSHPFRSAPPAPPADPSQAPAAPTGSAKQPGATI